TETLETASVAEKDVADEEELQELPETAAEDIDSAEELEEIVHQESSQGIAEEKAVKADKAEASQTVDKQVSQTSDKDSKAEEKNQDMKEAGSTSVKNDSKNTESTQVPTTSKNTTKPEESKNTTSPATQTPSTSKPVKQHEHTWVTENTPADCEHAGHTKTYCSGCGEVKEDKDVGAALGHDYSIIELGFAQTPEDCWHGAYYVKRCSRCNQCSDERIVVDRTPHQWDAGRVQSTGSCRPGDDKQVRYTCTACGWEEVRYEPSGIEHQWETITVDGEIIGCERDANGEFKLDANGDVIPIYEKIEITRCSVCGMNK
ncbi:MAG: hypothetical protein K6G30_03710, partial [Acetatifactor sp.]|nr:hypothetical protein [Acetatifactor sp.]